MANENLSQHDEIYIDIILFGNSTPPKEISRKLGITNATALNRGERNLSLDLPRANLWSLCSNGGNDVEEEWNSLKKIFNNHWNEFCKIANINGITKISIVVNIYTRILPIFIPASMVRDAAQINAIIDIEQYDYREELPN